MMNFNKRAILWIVGATAVVAAIITLVVVLSVNRTSKQDDSKDERQTEEEEERPEREPVTTRYALVDADPIPADVTGEALLREVELRGEDFDLWQLTTDEQRSCLEGLERSKADAVPLLKRIQAELKERSELMSKMQILLESGGLQSSDITGQVLPGYVKLLAFGAPPAMISKLESQLEAFEVKEQQSIFAQLFVSYLMAALRPAANDVSLRCLGHLRRLHALARKHSDLIKLTSLSILGCNDPLVVPLFDGLLKQDMAFDAFLALAMRMHLAMQVLNQGLKALTELPADGLSSLPPTTLAKFLAPSLPQNQDLTIQQVLSSINLPEIMRSLAECLQRRLGDMFEVYQFRAALNIRKATSFLPDPDSFPFDPKVKRLLCKAVPDPSNMLSTLVPPRPVHNSHAICYAAALSQALANFLPLFEQQLAMWNGGNAPVLDPDSETGWFMHVLRELNQNPGVRFNDNGSDFSHLASTGDSRDLLWMWVDAVTAENQLPKIDWRAISGVDLHNLPSEIPRSTGPLLFIFVHTDRPGPLTTPIPLALEGVQDAWHFQDPNTPAHKRFQLRAFTHGTGGHVTAHVQRADGTWWLCDDENITPLTGGPSLDVQAGHNYVLLYLVGES
jgi:hypothetical protein